MAKRQLDGKTLAFLESFHGQLKQMNLFELLGAEPSANLTRLRRAYHLRSKQIHPDRYYKRATAHQTEMLARCFRWVHGAFEFLKDERRRAAYRVHLRTRRQRQNAPTVVAVEKDTRLEFMIEDEEDFFSLFPPVLADLIGTPHRRGPEPAPPADGSFEFLSDIAAPAGSSARRPTPTPDDGTVELVSGSSPPAIQGPQIPARRKRPPSPELAPAPADDDAFEFVSDLSLPAGPLARSDPEPESAEESLEFVIDD